MTKVRVNPGQPRVTLPKSKATWTLMSAGSSDGSIALPRKYLSNNRTAIIIAGEFVAGNITLPLIDLNGSFENSSFKVSALQLSDAVLEHVVLPLARHGGVDMFIHIHAHCNTSMSNSSLHPVISEGDNRLCEPYSNHTVFRDNNASTGNQVFCMVECSRILGKKLIRTHLDPKQKVSEVVLQNEYSRYQANLASKENAMLRNEPYKYKVYLRHDEAIAEPIPNIESINFHMNTQHKYLHSTCDKMMKNESSLRNRHLFYGRGVGLPSRHFALPFALHNTFMIGLAEDVDIFLDRFEWLMISPLHTLQLRSNHQMHQKSGHGVNKHLSKLEYPGLCLTAHPNMHIVRIRNGTKSSRQSLNLLESDVHITIM